MFWAYGSLHDVGSEDAAFTRPLARTSHAVSPAFILAEDNFQETHRYPNSKLAIPRPRLVPTLKQIPKPLAEVDIVEKR